MKPSTKAVLFAIGLSLPIIAGANPGEGPRGAMGAGDCGPRAEFRGGDEGRNGPGPAFGRGLEELKKELKLTEAQQPAWNAFEKALTANRDTMRSTHNQPPKAAGEDPMDARISFMEQQLKSMKAVSTARKELYKKLTAEQKAVMDQHSQRMAPGPRGDRPRR